VSAICSRSPGMGEAKTFTSSTSTTFLAEGRRRDLLRYSLAAATLFEPESHSAAKLAEAAGGCYSCARGSGSPSLSRF
jgi:hypothetical protein